jgi:hypothetical protein
MLGSASRYGAQVSPSMLDGRRVTLDHAAARIVKAVKTMMNTAAKVPSQRTAPLRVLGITGSSPPDFSRGAVGVSP